MRDFSSFRKAGLLYCLGVSMGATDAAIAQVAPARVAPSPVRVTLQVDSALTARFDADAFDLKVSPTGLPGVNAEMQLVKQAGVHTGSLLAMNAHRTHALGATIEVLDSLGAAVMTFHLIDVTVVSQHLALAGNRVSLEQQSISQQEALSALTTDYQEATRQLATAEELARNHVGTRLELARARDRVSDLQRRVDLLRLRQGQTARQLGGTGVEETIVLHFAQLEVESRETGGRATMEGVVRPR